MWFRKKNDTQICLFCLRMQLLQKSLITNSLIQSRLQTLGFAVCQMHRTHADRSRIRTWQITIQNIPPCVSIGKGFFRTFFHRPYNCTLAQKFSHLFLVSSMYLLLVPPKIRPSSSIAYKTKLGFSRFTKLVIALWFERRRANKEITIKTAPLISAATFVTSSKAIGQRCSDAGPKDVALEKSVC